MPGGINSESLVLHAMAHTNEGVPPAHVSEDSK